LQSFLKGNTTDLDICVIKTRFIASNNILSTKRELLQPKHNTLI